MTSLMLKAICEAASRPSMRFVQPRTESQQAMQALHRVRESLVQDKVKTTNQMHAFSAGIWYQRSARCCRY
ncbi:hypothetical protein DJICPGNB_23735 [Escherichia coli]|nr:hypothetical protein DJICPGNB_23735 [Escherichia coli]